MAAAHGAQRVRASFRHCCLKIDREICEPTFGIEGG
jgi:hypothetical protein